MQIPWQVRIKSKLAYSAETFRGSPCWIFTGSLDSSGYGLLWSVNTMRKAHRLTYVEAKGPIPKGLQIDHLCRNRACCNPDHLEAVTTQENTRRGKLSEARGKFNAAKTHCPHGHPYSPENTYHGLREDRRTKRRDCRVCCLQRAMNNYQKKKLKSKKG